jgi:dienelactone hydrolase
MNIRGLLAALTVGTGVLIFAACGGEAVTGGPAETPAQGDAQVTQAVTQTATAAPAGGSGGGETAPRKLGTSAGATTTANDPAFVPLDGASAHFGQLDRAAYRIEMPDAWNGDLVLYAHGFAGFGTELAVEPPPRALRQYLVANGFAWAASSYSENGYVPGIGADDTLALKRHFAREFGDPERTYIAGASMGGNVVALALENHATEYDGGLALCGALGGIEQIDYLASWVAVAEYTSGLTFPIGEPGANLAPVFLTDLPRILGAPDAPTEQGRQFASVVKHLTGGPRPFFAEGFREQYIINFGLVLIDPERKLLVNRAATNADAVYEIDTGLGVTAEQLNANVRRYPSDPTARSAEAHPDAVPTTGRISVPLLTLHNTGDLFVPISMEQSYRAKVEAAGKGDLLVQRAVRAGGHCKFSEQELTVAFEDLVAWVKDGTKPKGEDLTGDLMSAGLEFTNPLREGDPGGVE